MSRPGRRTFPVTVHLFLRRGGEVFLLRRFNTGYQDGNYSVVAGHLDGGETVIQAAIREAREEVGIAIRPADLAVVGVMHRREGDERVDFFLSCGEWSGEPANCEPQRCDGVGWFPLEALPANLIAYVHKALQNWQQGVWFDEFGW